MIDEKNIFAAAIVGPTGVGKTKASVLLAKKINAQIVSADSMQIYKGMDIGTAKADDAEKDGIRHYMLDVALPNEEYNVVRYVKEAKQAICEICNNGFFPLVVGGTGLYADSLLNGVDFSRTVSDEEYRALLLQLCEKKGCEYIHKELERVDKISADQIHPNNVKRVIRALEIYHVTGKTKTECDAESLKNKSDIDCVKIGLYLKPEILYERIDLRVDNMLEKGLVDEVETLMKNGFSKTSSQAIGYREIIDYINGETSFDEAKRLLKRNSRRYAKRQYTWFMRDKSIHWIDTFDKSCDDVADACEYIINYKKKGRKV